MATTKKNLYGVVGLICLVLGVTGSVPLILVKEYGYAAGSSVLIIVGIILFAIAFGD